MYFNTLPFILFGLFMVLVVASSIMEVRCRYVNPVWNTTLWWVSMIGALVCIAWAGYELLFGV